MVARMINHKPVSTQGFAHLYPFQSHFMKTGGHDLHYVDQGSGPPIFMIHGNPTWSFYFRHLITHLSQNFRTIAPDHIGCGLSDKPDPQAYDYTLASRVADLDLLVEKLCPTGKISFIVHDWGGMIGLAWALDHLDRIDRIIITNTAGFLLPRAKTLPLLLGIIKYLKWVGVPAVLGVNAFARGALYLAAQTRLDPSVKQGLIAPYNSWKNRMATLKFVQDIPVSPKDPSYDRVARVDRELTRLDQSRLLFLWGARDFVFDLDFLKEFRHRFPGADFHVFPDAGHYLFEDKPWETLELIKSFLDRKPV